MAITPNDSGFRAIGLKPVLGGTLHALQTSLFSGFVVKKI